MFDYYELKFVFHGADCKRRAADMDEARAAKKELQAAGVKEITIFGVKKGTKEIQAAKKTYVKPEFKHEPAPKAAKTPKAKKAPATKNKAPKATKKQKDEISEMSADDLRAIDSIFSHDGKIKILKTNTPKREPAGQLDLFDVMKDDKKKVLYSFTQVDIKSLITAFYSLIQAGEKLPAGYKSILTTFEKSDTTGNVKIEFSYNEIKLLTKICQMYLRKFISDKGKSNIYKTIQELKKLFLMWIY